MKLSTLLFFGVVICAALLAACSSSTGSGAEGRVGEASSAIEGGDFDADAHAGKHHFGRALPGTNGRSCATCHVESEHFALSPQRVAAVYAKDPDDPLFNPIDADDPTAAAPTYDHLKAGLVRVTLKLADNLDVIDAGGNVITNADRTIWVWRGVPSTENVAYTGPYQYDGRAPTLEVQANGALHAHSRIDREPSDEVLEQISDFERTTFSSSAAREVADALEDGRAPEPLDLHFPPGSDEAAGQVLFQNICARCHGSPSTDVIDKAVFDSFFPLQHADGTIEIAGFLPAGLAVPAAFRHDLAPPHEGTLGISALTMLQQIGVFPNPSGLSFPQYRIRFYTDATRTQKLVDMPPPPPGIGPSLVVEPFSVDPGRAIISGDPYDWEGFKVPQLRGISKTAPYFHDASAPDLHAVLDEYSRLILLADPVLNLPPVFPPEGPGLPPESLSPTQKAQLFAFLQHL
jgi:cytochrome c peroxidase